MRAGRVVLRSAVWLAAAVAATGCGTTRVTDTQRAASEMLLISAAVDSAVGQIDFSALDGKPVYLDVQYLDGVVDKGYVISALRQHLLAHGAMLQEKREDATYVVEPRAGGVGTDKSSLLIGTPQITLPAIAAVAVPVTSVPEIALVKKTDQKGVAKLAVFAYNRTTGRALWQSGLVEASSDLKDTWVFGAGPFSRGSIRKTTELAGEPLPALPPLPFVTPRDDPDGRPGLLTQAVAEGRAWLNADAPRPPEPVPFGILGLTGPAAVVDRPLVPPRPADPTSHPAAPGVPGGND